MDIKEIIIGENPARTYRKPNKKRGGRGRKKGERYNPNYDPSVKFRRRQLVEFFSEELDSFVTAEVQKTNKKNRVRVRSPYSGKNIWLNPREIHITIIEE